MYPRLIVDKEKYRHNLQKLKDLCDPAGLSFMAVTKVFRAAEPLVEIINEEAPGFIADSRVENLQKMQTDLPKVLLRLPSVHAADAVVEAADISLNSEVETIHRLDAAAEKLGITHGVILMVDIGDLREGVYYQEDVPSLAKEIDAMQHIRFEGIGTNLTCYGGVLPTRETLGRLDRIKDDIETTLGRKLAVVSGGNSSHLHLLMQERSIGSFDNLRIGEALALGRETAYGEILTGFHDDVFVLEADVIEIKDKPSLPEGKIGMAAFGRKPKFIDKGIMRRAILGIGEQDVVPGDLQPIDDLDLLGSSSDHLIADVSRMKNLRVGSVVSFKPTYGGLLSLMTSDYVVKAYV